MIQRAHEAIGAPAFSVAEQAGRGLDYEQAIARARAWLVSAPSQQRYAVTLAGRRFHAVGCAAHG